MGTFHENLLQSFHNFRDKYLKANNKFFKFSYDSTSGKYGYTIDGTFHPFKTAHTGTYTASSRSASLDMGEDHEYRYVNTNSVPNSNSGTQTISNVYTSGNGYDMGATNTKRYIKTSGLMKTPTANKSITISSTGTTSNIDVKDYATASVTTSGLVKPSGTKSITTNGTNIDVSSYQYANVAVPNVAYSSLCMVTSAWNTNPGAVGIVANGTTYDFGAGSGNWSKTVGDFNIGFGGENGTLAIWINAQTSGIYLTQGGRVSAAAGQRLGTVYYNTQAVIWAIKVAS